MKTAFAKDGLLDELKKAFAERALNAEIDHHLDNGEEDGRPNSRNGYGRKSVLTETGKIELEVPRDRLSTFDPQLIAKYQRRFPGFDEKIVSMYARGMTRHLRKPRSMHHARCFRLAIRCLLLCHRYGPHTKFPTDLARTSAMPADRRRNEPNVVQKVVR